MAVYTINLPLRFEVEAEDGLIHPEVVELLTEAIFDWVEHGVKPNPYDVTYTSRKEW